MRSVYEERRAEAAEIEGQLLRGEDKIVPPPLFAEVCRLIWPRKTAAHLAAVGGRDERTARRWLAGEFEPPIIVILFVINKMFERS